MRPLGLSGGMLPQKASRGKHANPDGYVIIHRKEEGGRRRERGKEGERKGKKERGWKKGVVLVYCNLDIAKHNAG